MKIFLEYIFLLEIFLDFQKQGRKVKIFGVKPGVMTGNDTDTEPVQ